MRQSAGNHPDHVLLSCDVTANTGLCISPVLLSRSNFDNETETRIRDLAREPDVYERLVNSIAPSIYGSEDIKKAVACLLFGGENRGPPPLEAVSRPETLLSQQRLSRPLYRLHQNSGRWHAPAWRH